MRTQVSHASPFFEDGHSRCLKATAAFQGAKVPPPSMAPVTPIFMTFVFALPFIFPRVLPCRGTLRHPIHQLCLLSSRYTNGNTVHVLGGRLCSLHLWEEFTRVDAQLKPVPFNRPRTFHSSWGGTTADQSAEGTGLAFCGAALSSPARAHLYP